MRKDVRRRFGKNWNKNIDSSLPEKQKQSDALPLKLVNTKDGNIKKQVSNIAKALMRDYRFQNINEYRALLSLYDVTV